MKVAFFGKKRRRKKHFNLNFLRQFHELLFPFKVIQGFRICFWIYWQCINFISFKSQINDRGLLLFSFGSYHPNNYHHLNYSFFCKNHRRFKMKCRTNIYRTEKVEIINFDNFEWFPSAIHISRQQSYLKPFLYCKSSKYL